MNHCFKIYVFILVLFTINFGLVFNYVFGEDNKTRYQFSFKFGGKGSQDGQLIRY
jgi:hypothetical protein